MRRSDLVQHKEKEKGTTSRTSQIVFGERQHLLRVLDSLEGTDLPIARAQQERHSLEELIHARTRELNQINTAWDEKIGLVLSSDAKPEMLEKLAKQAPEEDFYLLRLISEHPRSNAKTLQRLGRHPYAAIRENVARHPNADAATLTPLSKDRSQPLWYLVAVFAEMGQRGGIGVGMARHIFANGGVRMAAETLQSLGVGAWVFADQAQQIEILFWSLLG